MAKDVNGLVEGMELLQEDFDTRCHRAARSQRSTTEEELVFDRDFRGTVSQDPEHRGSELCWASPR